MRILYSIAFGIMCGAITISAHAQNTLTAQEKKDGWKLLFDGKTTAGWRNFNISKAGPGWKVQNGELYLDKTVKEGRGDILTDAEYENYELSIEWKIDACGNSGIIFNVVEDTKYNATYVTGPEMQVLDNECHPDAKIIKHRAGDLYDLISSSTETVKPAGEWNKAVIRSDHGRMEFWLNGTKVVEFTMHDTKWDEMVAASKFKTMSDFGKALKGHIALQDHGDNVWYRNIKIRELK
jgi:cytochrome c